MSESPSKILLGRTPATFHRQGRWGWHEAGGVEVPKTKMFNVSSIRQTRRWEDEKMSWGHWWPKSQTQKVERWICWRSQKWELCCSMCFAQFYFLTIVIYSNFPMLFAPAQGGQFQNKRFWARVPRVVLQSTQMNIDFRSPRWVMMSFKGIAVHNCIMYNFLTRENLDNVTANVPPHLPLKHFYQATSSEL